jgi:hypothetical protein
VCFCLVVEWLSLSFATILTICKRVLAIVSLRGVEQLSLNLAAFLTICKRVFDSSSSQLCSVNYYFWIDFVT